MARNISEALLGEILNRALAFHQSGRFAQAEHLYKDALSARPRHFGALNLLGVLLAQNEKYEEAMEVLRRAVRINPQSESTQYNYGNVLRKLNRPAEALQVFDKALTLNWAAPDTWNSRGSTLNDLERFEEALRDFARALELRGQFPDALCNRGKALHGLQRHEEAVAAYDEALAMDPRLAEAWISRAEALLHLKRYEAALADYQKAIDVKPDLAAAWLGSGRALLALKRFHKALAAYDRAVSLKPELVEAWLGRANMLYELRRDREALAACDRVLSLKPDVPAAWLAGANLLVVLQRYDEALAAYEKALSLKPDLRAAKSGRLRTKLYLGDWSNHEEECASLLSSVLNGTDLLEPFVLAAVCGSAEVQLKCTELWVAENCPPEAPPLCSKVARPGDRIRLAYVSADFRDHAVAHLAAGLFEEHDRSRFDVVAISIGSDLTESTMRMRLKSAFERFIDAHDLSDRQLAELIHELNIEIAVDLNGFTKDARTTAFSRRPAPIQVNYLGFSGTMGAEYYDYIIADKIVIPPEQRNAYTENVVYLPNTYMVNVSKRPLPTTGPTRAEAHLPEHGFVFCAFNNFYKITPQVFDVWMRLLRSFEGSVLWLIQPDPAASANLRREAANRGVSGDRLVFSGRVPKWEDHLARYRLADLFLDTVPYNAHATTSDALWMGVPVITCLGSSFASRVAASLLQAVGLPELVTPSLRDYEELAMKIAGDPALVAALKTKLEQNRRLSPLFNTKGFTRQIESAYTMMWNRYQRGECPTSFAVEPDTCLVCYN